MAKQQRRRALQTMLQRIQSQWKCPKCTLDNDARKRRCVVCDCRRPVDPSTDHPNKRRRVSTDRSASKPSQQRNHNQQQTIKVNQQAPPRVSTIDNHPSSKQQTKKQQPRSDVLDASQKQDNKAVDKEENVLENKHTFTTKPSTTFPPPSSTNPTVSHFNNNQPNRSHQEKTTHVHDANHSVWTHQHNPSQSSTSETTVTSETTNDTNTETTPPTTTILEATTAKDTIVEPTGTDHCNATMDSNNNNTPPSTHHVKDVRPVSTTPTARLQLSSLEDRTHDPETTTAATATMTHTNNNNDDTHSPESSADDQQLWECLDQQDRLLTRHETVLHQHTTLLQQQLSTNLQLLDDTRTLKEQYRALLQQMRRRNASVQTTPTQDGENVSSTSSNKKPPPRLVEARLSPAATESTISPNDRFQDRLEQGLEQCYPIATNDDDAPNKRSAPPNDRERRPKQDTTTSDSDDTSFFSPSIKRRPEERRLEPSLIERPQTTSRPHWKPPRHNQLTMDLQEYTPQQHRTAESPDSCSPDELRNLSQHSSQTVDPSIDPDGFTVPKKMPSVQKPRRENPLVGKDDDFTNHPHSSSGPHTAGTFASQMTAMTIDPATGKEAVQLQRSIVRPRKASNAATAAATPQQADLTGHAPATSRLSNNTKKSSSKALSNTTNNKKHLGGGWISNVPAREFMSEMDAPSKGRLSTRSASNAAPRSTARTASSSRDDLWDSQEPDYAYKDVVRCKIHRDKLQGRDCPGCRPFYDVLRKTGHDVPDFNGETANSQHYSRHRARYATSESPTDFWELGFVDERKAGKESFP